MLTTSVILCPEKPGNGEVTCIHMYTYIHVIHSFNIYDTAADLSTLRYEQTEVGQHEGRRSFINTHNVHKNVRAIGIMILVHFRFIRG